MSHTLADHLLFAALVALPPTLGRFAFGRLQAAVAAGDGTVRVRYYRRTLLTQWLMTGLVLAVWLSTGRSLRDLGLLPWRGAVAAVIGLAVACAVAWVLMRQHRAIAGDAKAQASARRQIEPLSDFLPQNGEEDRWFAALSVTAGICEEVSHRGFLIAYLSVWIGLWPASLVSAVIFGISHAYQGVSGMLRTGVVGIVEALLYVGSGWLLPGMVLHAGIDVGSGRVVRAVRHATPPSAGTPAEGV